MLEQYLGLFVRSVFIDNMALTFFLGMCTFIAISKKVETAIGLGVAVIVVLSITAPVNNLIFNYLLRDGALSWAGFSDVDLSFLGFLSYIGVIAAMVQILDPLETGTSVILRSTPCLFPTGSTRSRILLAIWWLFSSRACFSARLTWMSATSGPSRPRGGGCG